jgi:NhaP-type Na+/H+ or K+/H+ antiporter
MTNAAILAASGLLLFAYLLDIVGRRLRLPGVVLMIATGIVARQALDEFGVRLQWVDPVVPVIGTLGLILIVLEGALDLRLSRERTRLIAVSIASAVLGFSATLVAFTLLFAWALHWTAAAATLAAMPFAVISSAVAIPSAAGLPAATREFVVYESSLSDIIGVLVFYAWLGADGSLGEFAWDLFGGGAVSVVAALAASLALYYFVGRIEGHVRFLPLLAGLVCLYAVGKAIHLSPLIIILVCGLQLNNPTAFAWHPRIRALHTPEYEGTLQEFKSLVAELTFATKSFFFLLLGYWTDVSQMLSWQAWAMASAIVAIIYGSRFALLAALRQPVGVLVWVAPRGLITVLLFLAAANAGKVADFPFGAVMLVVLATSSATTLAQRAAAGAAAPAAPVPAGAGDPP